MPTSNDPIKALGELVQFCVEYANTFSGRPATQQAIIDAVKAQATIINEALPKETVDASHPN